MQAFRHRVQREMRTCNPTKTVKLEEVVEAVAVHLFARGLSSAAAKQRVLETGDKTLADAAVHAQAVVLSTETGGISSDSTPVFFTNQLPPPTGPVRQEHKCSYCGRTHPPGRNKSTVRRLARPVKIAENEVTSVLYVDHLHRLQRERELPRPQRAPPQPQATEEVHAVPAVLHVRQRNSTRTLRRQLCIMWYPLQPQVGPTQAAILLGLKPTQCWQWPERQDSLSPPY